MKILIPLALVGLILGCSSNPHKAKDINTKIDNANQISGNTQLGIKDGNLVVQKKIQMNEGLRRLQNEVYSMEDRVYGNRKYGSEGLYGALKRCKKEVSMKKNGGTGKLSWTEPMDRITDKEDNWNIGLDEQQKIVGVKEEFLKDRIKRFSNYKKILMQREDEYKEKLEICDAKLQSQMDSMKK